MFITKILLKVVILLLHTLTFYLGKKYICIFIIVIVIIVFKNINLLIN